MTQNEYKQKKRECWDAYIAKHGLEYAIPEEAFDYAFDRAYILGKEKETITQEEIEKVAKEYAAEVDKNVRDLYGIENPPTSLTFGECAAESFREGVKFVLGKQTETIAQEDIEKAAEAFATPPIGNGGMFTREQVKGLLVKFAQLSLGKQEKDRKGKPLNTYLTDEDKENVRAEYKSMVEAYEYPRNNGEKEYAKGYMEALEWLFGIRFLTNDNK